jgi:FixJ family two-component response regulator
MIPERPVGHRDSTTVRRRDEPAGEQAVSGSDPIVFVVEDDASVREALESLFGSVGLDVRSFGSAQGFLSEPRGDCPACLVVDVHLRGMSGLDLQRQLAERDIALPIIVITGHGDIPMTVRAIRAGAVDVLSKPVREQDLLDAVQQALDRSRVLREEQAAMADLQARFDSLTPREREVMGGVAAGLLNKQIAYDLSISEVTVKIHHGQVMQKMGTASVADLVRMADRLGSDPQRPSGTRR